MKRKVLFMIIKATRKFFNLSVFEQICRAGVHVLGNFSHKFAKNYQTWRQKRPQQVRTSHL